MNILRTIQRTLLIALAVPAVICSLPAQTTPTTPAWGTPVNGLQISLSQDASVVLPSHNPALKLDLQNVGTHDLIVILGGGCGPMAHSTNNIELILMDSSGTSKRLYTNGTRHPLPGGCAGGVSVFSQTMPPGRISSTPIMLDYYETKDFAPARLPDGAYTLQAEISTQGHGFDATKLAKDNQFDHGRPLFWWLGTATSNQLKIYIPAP